MALKTHKIFNPSWCGSKRRYLHVCHFCGWRFMRRAAQQKKCPACHRPVDATPEQVRSLTRRAVYRDLKNRLTSMPLDYTIVEPWPGQPGEKHLQEVILRFSIKTGKKFLCRPTLRGLSVRRVA